jgi:hypothetical protein
VAGGSNERLRFSVCSDARTMFEGPQVNQFTAKAIKSAAGVLDELCWLRTVINKDDKADEFRIEVPALAIPSVWKQMLDECKAAHVELMVGFAHASTFITKAGTKFLTWLYAQSPTPSLATWASKLRTFCKSNFPGMHGISFDLENLDVGGLPVPKSGPDRDAELARRGQRWSDFYGAVADAFATEGWMVGAFLKPKISDTNGTRTLKDDTVALHRYEMANGHPNLILRPMAYEAEPSYGMTTWFGEICDYAVGAVQPDGTLKGGKCKPENFQLTLKVSSSRNPGQIVRDPQGRVVPELGIVGQKTVLDACKTVFRPHQVGVCLFPGTGGRFYWKDANAALNNNVAGSKKGWPFQWPLSDDPATFFKK